jgi:hypothetical protein
LLSVGNMIKTGEFQKFEMELSKKERVSIRSNFRIVEALYKEAVVLGVIPLKNPLEGLEVDIRIAKVINHVSKTT